MRYPRRFAPPRTIAWAYAICKRRATSRQLLRSWILRGPRSKRPVVYTHVGIRKDSRPRTLSHSWTQHFHVHKATKVQQHGGVVCVSALSNSRHYGQTAGGRGRETGWYISFADVTPLRLHAILTMNAHPPQYQVLRSVPYRGSLIQRTTVRL